MTGEQRDAEKIGGRWAHAPFTSLRDGGVPFLRREIAASNPCERDQFALLVFVHGVDERADFLADGRKGFLGQNADEFVIRGIRSVGRDSLILGLELASLKDHVTNFLGVDVGHGSCP